jgi:hypothetical protein
VHCWQVGIIALNLIGEPLRAAPEGPPGFLDTEGPTSHELPYYNRAAGEVADLQLDVHVDSMTAARIKVRRGLLCSSPGQGTANSSDSRQLQGSEHTRGCMQQEMRALAAGAGRHLQALTQADHMPHTKTLLSLLCAGTVPAILRVHMHAGAL